MGCKPNLLSAAALALLALAPALAADSGSPAALEAGRARASYRAGDHFGALELTRRALALDPGDPQALEFQAQLTRDAEGVVAALPLFEKALARSPDSVELLGEYAATLGEAGRNRDMLRTVRRMTELDPGNRRALFLQAMLAARARRDELARRLLWRAAGDDEGTPAETLLGALLELRSGSPAQAVESLDELVRLQPDNLDAQILLGRALLANGETNEVAARLGLLADRGDASPYLLTLVGRAYEELGQRKRAARFLDRATRPPSPGAWTLPANGAAENQSSAKAVVQKMRSLLAAGRSSEAALLAARLSRRYKGSADVARAAGDVAFLTGRRSEALTAYRRAATVRADASLVQRIVVLGWLGGERSGSQELLERRVALNPGERSSAVLLAQLHADQGNWRAAADLLERAARSGGEDPQILAALARARLELGETGAALADARRAHQLQRGNGAVSDALARSLAAAKFASALAAR